MEGIVKEVFGQACSNGRGRFAAGPICFSAIGGSAVGCDNDVKNQERHPDRNSGRDGDDHASRKVIPFSSFVLANTAGVAKKESSREPARNSDRFFLNMVFPPVR
jgi:hypothetical protein